MASQAASEGTAPVWLAGPDGYALAIVDGTLRCRNAKGKELKSIPRKVASSPQAQELRGLLAWLDEHARACRRTVEQWMLRSLPVPAGAVGGVFDDPAWQAPLANAVITPLTPDGARDQDGAGLLRAAEPERGLGVVTLDGETRWLQPEHVALPHPMLLDEREDFRELVTELGVQQGISQLFRDTYDKPEAVDAAATSLTDYAEGRFEQLNHALGRCRTLGYAVRGGFARCPVVEEGRLTEARYWVGADAPEVEALTGELLWVDRTERALALGEVGPVAWSEGVRMAAAIYGGRVVDA